MGRKKKIPQTEFQRWADYALEFRAKADSGEIEFEVYRAEMRK